MYIWLYKGSTSGGSGGGHGGSGGRGSALTSVGTGYDSMYKPHLSGSAGGHGYYFGLWILLILSVLYMLSKWAGFCIML